MQLFLNATSPFARVARIAALEKGLAERVQLVWSDPWNHDPALLAVHPQLRIPVLVTDEGQAIAESLLIAQYLDQIGTGPALVPPAQCAAVLAQASVGYGLMEAAFALVIARKYQGAEADASVLGQRRLAALDRTLAQLEQTPPCAVGANFTLDQITVAVGLEYLRFRLPALLPAGAYPRLHTWLQAARQRPSLHATRFA